MSDYPTKDPDSGPEDEPGMPHFQRPDGRYISYEPDGKLWDVLPYMSEDELEGLGLQPWDEEREVWLFPVEWYEHIPEGLEIVTILDETKEFDRDEDHKEGRFGALPFGIEKKEGEYNDK